jgi:hypothetical protein
VDFNSDKIVQRCVMLKSNVCSFPFHISNKIHYVDTLLFEALSGRKIDDTAYLEITTSTTMIFTLPALTGQTRLLERCSNSRV